MFLLVVFHVSFLHILRSSTPIEHHSFGFWGYLQRFYCYQAGFLAFDRTHAFVDPVTHPSVLVEGECKCGYHSIPADLRSITPH